MLTLIERVKEKINKKLEPEQLTLIDNSILHAKHKSFHKSKFHLKLTIKSEKLKNMSRIEAHKKIFSLLKEEMKDEIHALEIEIE